MGLDQMKQPNSEQLTKQISIDAQCVAISVCLHCEDKRNPELEAALLDYLPTIIDRVQGNRNGTQITWDDARLLHVAHLRFSLLIMEHGLLKAIEMDQ
jgi:hypothetical protein